jgi:hypothetical protein
MVNSKNVAFRVNKQTPWTGPPPQAYGTVINCRKPGGKRALGGETEVKSQRVRLSKIDGSEDQDAKRKRGDEGVGHLQLREGVLPVGVLAHETGLALSARQSSPTPQPQVYKPTKLRRGKTSSKGVDIDCWHTILSFSDPAQLLELRTKISSCYRFLRDYPMLWKHSRTYYFHGTLPDPPAELTEFQYAHLRHGYGCMRCGTRTTRKTYWAFLRRWCKVCLQLRTIKEHDAMALFKNEKGEDISYIRKCLPSGIFDSWGNFVGVGPATTHSLKTVYLTSEIQQLVADFVAETKSNDGSEPVDMTNWIAAKVKVVNERHEFARKMELWEDMARQSTSSKHSGKKAARKTFFVWKASLLSPPMSLREVESCPSYRRAIAIPKEPNMTSWLLLKPKLEKEVAELRAKGGLPPMHSASGVHSASGDPTVGSAAGGSTAYSAPGGSTTYSSSSDSTINPSSGVLTTTSSSGNSSAFLAPSGSTTFPLSGISSMYAGHGGLTMHQLSGGSTMFPTPGNMTAYAGLDNSTLFSASGGSTMFPVSGSSIFYPASGSSSLYPALGIPTPDTEFQY